MKKEVWILVFLLFFSTLCSLGDHRITTAGPNQVEEIERLEAFLDGIIISRMDEKKITGVTLSVVKDQEILLSKGYGYIDLTRKREVDPESTLFRLGSTSKLFTWTAVMQLVEKGRLDLEEDINMYLDSLIPTDLLDGRKGEPITLAHLLTHTPGFEDIGQGLFVRTEEEMTSLKEYIDNHLPARVFPPGEVLSYSNYGTALAGYIVERVSGQSFQEYIEEHIFIPLEMEQSTFNQPIPESMEFIQAYNYARGEYHRGGFEYISGTPAGAMSSTAFDMAHFMIAHLQKGSFKDHQILHEETAKRMHSQQFTHHPKVDGMTYGFIEDTFNGRRVISHGGNTQLFHTGLFLLLEENLGLFISSTSECIGRESLFQALMDYYYPDPSSLEIESPIDSRERIPHYLGEYRPNRSNFTTYENLLHVLSPIQVKMNHDGYLQTNLYGEMVQLLEIEPGVFRQRYSQGFQMIGTLAFIPGPQGSILMAPDGPMTYSKTPWYGTILFLGLLTIGGLFVWIGSIGGWTIAFIVRHFSRVREKIKTPILAKIARINAVTFGLLASLFLLGLVSIFTTMDPAYGAPRVFYGLTPMARFIIIILPWILCTLGITMTVFTILSWWKGYWTMYNRIHYLCITISALGLLWVLRYSNVL